MDELTPHDHNTSIESVVKPDVLSLDSETCLFRAGVMAPEAVCYTWQMPGEEPQIIHAKDTRTYPLLRTWLEDPTILLVGHNMSYDLAVIGAQFPDLVSLIFKKLDQDLVTDTMLRQKLLDIAAGCYRGHLKTFFKETKDEETGLPVLIRGVRFFPYNYGLADLTYRSMGYKLDKDEWRKRYGEFIDIPISEWPEGARTYPLEDAKATLGVFLKQEEHVQYIPDQFRQMRAAWALHLTSVWGLRTHKAGVDALEKATLDALAKIEDGLKESGLVRHDGSRDTKKAAARMKAVCAAANKPLRLTDKGGVSLDKDACKASMDDILEDYAELTVLKTVINKDIPVIRSGLLFPVHTSYGMAASGRSTSAKPAVQNPRRDFGVRECWMPRDGHIYAQADYASAELCGLAQVCISLFGESELGKIINAGRDPLTEFASGLLGISYEEGIRRKKLKDDEQFNNARQTSKVAMYGMPGGLGADKLVLFARKTYKTIITIPEAKELKEMWLTRFPEMRKYFKYCGDLACEDDGTGTLTQLFTGRIRGGAHYTALANSWFQGLISDCAKNALYLVQKACYSQHENILYGSRPVLFVHDEIVMEIKEDYQAHDKAVELSRLMCEGANKYLPDVPVKADPELTRVWSKEAHDVHFKPTKRLIPWEPGMKYFVFRLPNSTCYVPASTPARALDTLQRYCYPQAPVHTWPLLSEHETEKDAEAACL